MDYPVFYVEPRLSYAESIIPRHTETPCIKTRLVSKLYFTY